MVQQKRRKPRKTARFLNMLLLVFAFLVVFEGRLIINIASKGGINKQVDEQLNKYSLPVIFRIRTKLRQKVRLHRKPLPNILPTSHHL